MKLQEIKSITGMTSEAIFGIKAQPEANCPTIDGYIKDAGFHIDNVVEAESEEETKREGRFAKNEVRDMMEDLRARFDSLREWGEAWKEMAKELYDKVENLDEREAHAHYVSSEAQRILYLSEMDEGEVTDVELSMKIKRLGDVDPYTDKKWLAIMRPGMAEPRYWMLVNEDDTVTGDTWDSTLWAPAYGLMDIARRVRHDFGFIMRANKEDNVFTMEAGNEIGGGPTPTEAAANLWIKLLRKSKEAKE